MPQKIPFAWAAVLVSVFLNGISAPITATLFFFKFAAGVIPVVMFALVALAAVAPVSAQQTWDTDFASRPQETSECPENSVYVPGANCVPEGRMACGAFAIRPALCSRPGDIALTEPLSAGGAFGDPPDDGGGSVGSCENQGIGFFVVRPSYENERGGLSYRRVEIGGAACSDLNDIRQSDNDGNILGCCFRCSQARQRDGFCQAIPSADAPDCSRPGWAAANPGSCVPDPDRPECSRANCTENFAGDPCCVAGDGTNEPPEQPPGKKVKKPPKGPTKKDDGRPNQDKPAGPGNRPAGPGVSGDAGTIGGGDSDAAANVGGNSMGHRNAAVSGVAKGVSRLDACKLAKRFLDPCDTISAVCVAQASLGDNPPCSCERADSPEALRAAAQGPGRQCVAASNGVSWCYYPGHSNCAGRVYYDTSCETYTPNFNDDCDGVCDECDELALQDLRFVQCPGNEPPADNTQTSVKLGETWYCNAVVSGARWCAAPSTSRDPYDFNIENPCSETIRRVPDPPAPPDDQGPGDPNGYCTAAKIAANDPACAGVSEPGGDVPPGGVGGGGFNGLTFEFDTIGITLAGLFSIPENDRTTVLLEIPPGLTRTITIAGSEFIIFDQSILTKAVSLAFCDNGDDACLDNLDYNPISESLITMFVSGNGLETTRAEFVFGDPDTARFTGFDRPNCVEPVYNFGVVAGRDVHAFVDGNLFEVCDILEGEDYGTGLTLADLILALNIFFWLLAGAFILLGG